MRVEKEAPTTMTRRAPSVCRAPSHARSPTVMPMKADSVRNPTASGVKMSASKLATTAWQRGRESDCGERTSGGFGEGGEDDVSVVVAEAWG